MKRKYLYEDGKFVTEGFAVYRKASDEFSTDDLEYLSINDPKVLSGEYVFFMKGSALYKNNKTNEVHRLSPNDHRILSGEYSHLSKGKTLVRNTKTGEVSMGELRDDTSNFESIHKGTFLYKDLSGNLLRADTTDPKVLSGELIPFNKGTMFYFKKDDSERKLVRLSIDDPRVLSGEYQFILSGKTKIHNKLLKQEKSVLESEVANYLETGWELGVFPRQKIVCPYCSKEGLPAPMKRHHFENCKFKR